MTCCNMKKSGSYGKRRSAKRKSRSVSKKRRSPGRRSIRPKRASGCPCKVEGTCERLSSQNKKIYTGPCGGMYYKKKGKKVYI